MKTRPVSFTLPEQGESPDRILLKIDSMQQEDVKWQQGKVWSLVYYADEIHDQLLKSASNALFSTNYLNPFAFKSLHRMEQEVVHMTRSMLHGKEGGVGVMTSGGTESILAAMYCYRQWAKKERPRAKDFEVIAPSTIHPAFDKAAEMFGMVLRKVPVDTFQRAVPAKMEKCINENTILLLASAPSYPNGVLDPVEAIAAIGEKHTLPLHVDACVGGFMLPWVEQLGYPTPLWDFRVAGVTSISADVHKFGFGAKGASVILYRSMRWMHHQFFISTDFPGGIYISPTLLGSRSGGPIAAAWAGMMHLGRNGYIAMAKKLMKGASEMRTGLTSIPGISIVGEPCMNILSYTIANNKPDIFVVADQMEEKGWVVDRQQFPDCIHLTILPTNVDFIDQYLKDLRESVAFAFLHNELTAKGNAAVYGLMARIPFRGMVEDSVKKIMEELFGEPVTGKMATNPGNIKSLRKNPAWMGAVSRFLSVWKRWRRYFNIQKV